MPTPIASDHHLVATQVEHPTKRVLVLRYSQSGQLNAIVDRLLQGLTEANTVQARIQVHIETLRPVVPYPFPWTLHRFFDAFPESAHMVAPALQPLSLQGDEDFDLVILPYQVWFLAPSLPVTGFLKHPVARKLLAGKPVVTVIACRNMWLLAHEKMKGMLKDCGARLLDNIVLTDPSPALLTLITTPYWMLTGRRQCLSLPVAGVDAATIASCRRFGLALRDALAHNAERANAPMLQGLGACVVDPRLYISEKAGTRSFYVWGKLLRLAGGPQARLRQPLLLLYVLFLLALILSVVPLSLLIQTLLAPLLGRQRQALKEKFERPSGSGRNRMHTYEY